MGASEHEVRGRIHGSQRTFHSNDRRKVRNLASERILLAQEG